MEIKHPSDSTEQQEAQKEILDLVNDKLKLQLTSRTLFIKDTKFSFNGYSDYPPIICEIYSRIGKMKVAQYNKVGRDILKMLLLEKMQTKLYRKIIVFADEEAAQSFIAGKSWYAKLNYYFNVEIMVVEITEELRTTLIAAQKRQYR